MVFYGNEEGDVQPTNSEMMIINTDAYSKKKGSYSNNVVMFSCSVVSKDQA